MPTEASSNQSYLPADCGNRSSSPNGHRMGSFILFLIALVGGTSTALMKIQLNRFMKSKLSSARRNGGSACQLTRSKQQMRSSAHLSKKVSGRWRRSTRKQKHSNESTHVSRKSLMCGQTKIESFSAPAHRASHWRLCRTIWRPAKPQSCNAPVKLKSIQATFPNRRRSSFRRKAD